MAQELRKAFHRALERQEIAMGAILGVVPAAISRATEAMLAGDDAVADELAGWRAMLGELNSGVDQAAAALITREAPVAGDLRLLLAVTRLVPVLSDSMDLVADVISPALIQVGPELPGRVRLLCAELGESCAATWSAVEELWRERERHHVAAVRSRHDVLADVRSSLNGELASGSVDVSVAMMLAMAGRSFERLGRHAGTSARLIEPLVDRSAVPGRAGGAAGALGGQPAGRSYGVVAP